MGIKVAIVGASGFVGQRLIKALEKSAGVASIRGLSRSQSTATGHKFEHVACDLFSLKDVDLGLQGIDEAIYLVHSMLPSSELAQGSFEDYDLILADNFARACVKNKIRRVIYLSGVIPAAAERETRLLSKHLKSRLEVEKVFAAYGLPLVSLRASIIMGSGGSSFEMILRLVDRLPAMICPAWTRQRSNPIHIDDVAETFRYVLNQPQLLGVFDLAGPEELSYYDMIRQCAHHFKKRRWFVNVPFFSPKLSRLWVSTITGAPSNLVYPLIESLKHDMRSDPQKTLKIPHWHYKTFDDALTEAGTLGKTTQHSPKAYKVNAPPEKLHVVQSVQRLDLPSGFDAPKAAHAYTDFLNRFFRGIIFVKTVGETSTFFIRFLNQPLLVLEYSVERSSADRVLFYIKGGLLDRGRDRARLEFRQCRHEKSFLVAIHDYRPSLPWYVYKFTQALFHLHVMNGFKKHLQTG